MTVVRVIRNWDWPDLMRQSPAGMGIWEGIRFSETEEVADLVVVLNRARHATRIMCPPGNVWALMQEPPIGPHRPLHRGLRVYSRVYTQDPDLRGPTYIHSQPALPWHVNKNYDELSRMAPPQKERGLSWITSNKSSLPGHRERLAFLDRVRPLLDFDLFGFGFRPLDDKWDALAPFRYSLVYENFRNPWYWSEKLADALLAWTMPIYVGCGEIASFLPREAVLSIDPQDENVIDKIREAMDGDAWQSNRDAIAVSREMILKQHQFFPFIAGEIGKGRRMPSERARRILIRERPSLMDQIAFLVRRGRALLGPARRAPSPQ